MDVESKQTLTDAINQAHTAADEVSDRLNSDVQSALAAEKAAAEEVIIAAIDSFRSAMTAVIRDASAQLLADLDKLDGWSLNVTLKKPQK